LAAVGARAKPCLWGLRSLHRICPGAATITPSEYVPERSLEPIAEFPGIREMLHHAAYRRQAPSRASNDDEYHSVPILQPLSTFELRLGATVQRHRRYPIRLGQYFPPDAPVHQLDMRQADAQQQARDPLMFSRRGRRGHPGPPVKAGSTPFYPQDRRPIRLSHSTKTAVYPTLSD
jgi:hypothetical protein